MSVRDGMNLDEALCIVLKYQNMKQSDMAPEQRTVYQRALRMVDTSASIGENAELQKLGLSA